MQIEWKQEFNKSEPNSLQDKAGRDPDLLRRIGVGRARARMDAVGMEMWAARGFQSWYLPMRRASQI